MARVSFRILGILVLFPNLSFANEKVPERSWEVAPAEALGFTSERLQEAEEYALSISTAAVMVVVDGCVLRQWGEVARILDARIEGAEP